MIAAGFLAQLRNPAADHNPMSVTESPLTWVR